MNDGEDFFVLELKEFKKGGSKGATVVIVSALDYALDMVGKPGKEVIRSMLDERYGLHAADIVAQPGKFMSALRDIFGESYEVIETRLLQKVEEETGLRGDDLESTVELVKHS